MRHWNDQTIISRVIALTLKPNRYQHAALLEIQLTLRRPVERIPQMKSVMVGRREVVKFRSQ